MKMEPLITVITASYNSKYIYDSINSVLSQTYEKIEYIVTDDGTNGFNSKKIELYIKENKKRNITSFHVIHHASNVGTVRNLNYAIETSHGKYIFFLSADDIYADSDTLSRWVNDMEKKGAYLSVSSLIKCDENLFPLHSVFPSLYQKFLLTSGNNKSIFSELAKGNFILGCCTAYSRICFEKYGFFDESYYLIEDYPYILSYVRKNGRIDYFDRPCIKYRCGGVSSSARFNAIYEKDSDLIIQNEILPYVRFKIWYRLIYGQWKRNQKIRFWDKIASAKLPFKIYLYITNPIQLCMSLNQRIRKDYTLGIRGGME